MECRLSNVVGARIGIYPMRDDFVAVILGAVQATDQTGLAVLTDDLGTTVQGNRANVFRFVRELFLRAAATGGHVVANVLFSVGCPGDVPENIGFDVTASPTQLPNETTPVACAWSLYPLGDPDYFQVIASQIATVQAAAELKVTSYHYCTRLDGSARAVFAQLEKALATVSQTVRHTVIHATFSIGSPSPAGQQINIAKEVR
jgi:uncharacterized protein YqgV (UPF0045/DUF77 family)